MNDNSPLIQAALTALLGFVVWLLQRQIAANTKAREAADKAIEKALKDHEERLREMELKVEVKISRADLDAALDRALKPINEQMSKLNDHLLRVKE